MCAARCAAHHPLADTPPFVHRIRVCSFAAPQREVAIQFAGPPDSFAVMCLEQHGYEVPVAKRRKVTDSDAEYDASMDARTCDVMVSFGAQQVAHSSGTATASDQTVLILEVELLHMGAEIKLPKTRQIRVKLDGEVDADAEGQPIFRGKSFGYLTGTLHAQPRAYVPLLWPLS